MAPVDLEVERGALREAREAATAQLDRLASVRSIGADEYSEGFIDAVVAARMEQLRRELTVFGRIDDDLPWRIGLFGVERGGEQLVVDWRARFAEGFYQATATDPRGLRRRVSYVGCIDDLMVEDFATGEVSGSSPLLAELSRSRGTEMRAAVATLQADQDHLVRLAPEHRLVLRGGPGTGKTVVGLHRAAWLTYHDRRITSDRILVLGPSDRFLRFVATVLPTLGEARIEQSTLERHLRAPSTPAGSHPGWPELLDRFEAELLRPAELRIRGRIVPEQEVAGLLARLAERRLPWRDRRSVLVDRLAHRTEAPRAEVDRATRDVMAPMSAAAAWRKLRARGALERLGAGPDLVAEWARCADDGAIRDELRARFEGVATRYAHVIVDEAQDLTELQLRAVERRADGLTLVGDDAQRSAPGGLGLVEAARRLGVGMEEMTTAYRMSAEIVEWLNAHAEQHRLPAVRLVGVRPTGVAVRRGTDVESERAALARRWPNVAIISRDDVWSHKGVEYDGVVVDATGMPPAELYLAASRAAHELVVVGDDRDQARSP